MAPSLEVAYEVEQVVSALTTVAKALQTTIFVANILLSKSLQDLWGMLNTQAITIHLMLFRCSYTLPGFVCLFNKLLSNLNQKDMYPTGEIYPIIFNFTETESPIEHFEILGYEGANFVELSGSLLINIVLAFSFEIAVSIVERVCIHLHTNPIARRLGTKIDNSSFVAGIVIMYMQGFMESLICTILSLKG
jgi:hypothetical protein